MKKNLENSQMSKKTKSLKELTNIGDKIALMLLKVGIESKDDFLQKDPYVTFDKMLKKVDPNLCRCALACIVGASLNLPWHKITKESATEFEKKYPKHKWKNKC